MVVNIASTLVLLAVGGLIGGLLGLLVFGRDYKKRIAVLEARSVRPAPSQTIVNTFYYGERSASDMAGAMAIVQEFRSPVPNVVREPNTGSSRSRAREPSTGSSRSRVSEPDTRVSRSRVSEPDSRIPRSRVSEPDSRIPRSRVSEPDSRIPRSRVSEPDSRNYDNRASEHDDEDDTIRVEHPVSVRRAPMDDRLASIVGEAPDTGSDSKLPVIEIQTLTQVQYDALPTKNEKTLYLIVDRPSS